MTNNEKKRLREQGIKLLRDFFECEYGDDWEEDFVNLWRIPLAYVPSPDDMTYTEVAVDLMNCRINTYLGDDQIHIRQVNFRNIKELVDALSTITFDKIDELADLSQDEAEELDRRLMDAFARSMRSGGRIPMEVKCLEENWTK